MRDRNRVFVLGIACLLVMLAGTTLVARRVRANPIAASAPDARDEIRSLLDRQATDWNRGDLDGFLTGYWNSDQTAFVGSQGILHGWQALLERYRKSYPDRKAMGTLAFSGLEITVLCPDAALVLGKWHLEREAGPVGGVFSLVLRRFPEGWRVIADHTSVVPASTP